LLRENPDGFEFMACSEAPVWRGCADQLKVRRRWLIFNELLVLDIHSPGRYRGLRRADAKSLAARLRQVATRARVEQALQQIQSWNDDVGDCLEKAKSDSRWIPEATTARLESGRPDVDTSRWFSTPTGAELEVALDQEERAAIVAFGRDLRALVRATNEWVVQNELVARRDFFDRIESSPLTEEQARAVICFDNRVLVVAAAGSGKTSVMVARAAYAIHRGFVRPERILLLAFNRDAAVELQDRVTTRLAALGIPSAGLTATTFHAFGLRAIGQATGRKPRLASWLDGGQDVEMVLKIVDELRDESFDFRFAWDVFRLLYARVGGSPDALEPDAWDKDERRTGLRTFNGEVVKSEGERLIADWLFLNGVKYQYEKPYSADVATSTHSQYRPDFYYPDVDVWHEHWAIGYDGEPPASFVGYADSMRWKREVHAAQGTALIETEWAAIVDRSGFNELAAQLRAAGLTLDWNPDRPMPGATPMPHEDLGRLVRTFMAHVKSNGLTPEAIEHRLTSLPARLRNPRTRMFLQLYWQIHTRWEQRLVDDDAVDFEDMLVRAAQHAEEGAVGSEYELVLVDEFQDASQARARLVAALAAGKNKYLLAVGDDWQAINRFAGADISVMTNFEQRFGAAQVLHLQTTFRCSQEICDVSSAFVSKNPSQLRKRVSSAVGPTGNEVRVVLASSRDAVPGVIANWLDALAAKVAAGEVLPTKGEAVTVDVLGRYRFDEDLVPPPRRGSGLAVTFRTVHSAKGLEADYVIIPNLERGKYGFPSQIADDAVLELAMTDAEDFPHSEERRLLYVALTRARCQVVLVGVAGGESPFLVELMAEGLIGSDDSGAAPTLKVCPACGTGTLVVRSGPYGAFFGCTSFPRCTHKEKTYVSSF
jgi:DNA helicase-4